LCVGGTSNIAFPSATYNFGITTLKNGSKGEAVKELQRFLNAKLNLGLVVDGELGPKTLVIVKQWQKDNGLVADGLVGAKTKAKMNVTVQ
jgi:peptidoglycan hydrolase-like protein with peptidoglycan-binding domain